MKQVINNDEIYLDHQATTPVDYRVLDAMLPYFSNEFANPHGNTYTLSTRARNAVEISRQQIAVAVGASPQEIYFTGSATESNNLALFGTALASKKKRIAIVATEHKSVIEPAIRLRSQGYQVDVFKVAKNGILNPEHVRIALKNDTIVLSVMLVNNEIGVIQPVGEIAQICREKGVLIHCDCAQALGKISVNLDNLGVDLATFSSHKAYGPKGIGAIYIRQKPKVLIKPLILGGGQEGGLRSGTLPVPLCVGFGIAASLVKEHLKTDVKRINELTGKLYDGICKVKPDILLNGDPDKLAPGCLSVSFPGYRGESLIEALSGIACSLGSSCDATSTNTSHVLRGIGLSKVLADSTLRFGIGRGTDMKQIRAALDIIENTFT